MEQEKDLIASTAPAEQNSILYVLIPPSPLFAAHWSFFIPDLSQIHGIKERSFYEPSIGRRIHVAGDRLNGFALEIVRSYDFQKHRNVGPARKFAVGTIPARFLTSSSTSNTATWNGTGTLKDEDEGGGIVNNQPIDQVEEICVEVEAPGPSLRRVADRADYSNGRSKLMREEVKDCQWWVKRVVQRLVDRQILEPLTEQREGDTEKAQRPLEIILKLPIH